MQNKMFEDLGTSGFIHSQPKMKPGRLGAASLPKRAAKRTHYIEYEPGGALDSQTTDSQYVDGLIGKKPRSDGMNSMLASKSASQQMDKSEEEQSADPDSQVTLVNEDINEKVHESPLISENQATTRTCAACRDAKKNMDFWFGCHQNLLHSHSEEMKVIGDMLASSEKKNETLERDVKRLRAEVEKLDYSARFAMQEAKEARDRVEVLTDLERTVRQADRAVRLYGFKSLDAFITVNL
ncbi:hypothetical protein EVG20_g8520 [Dentipellis fragilis]|uniref:Uncharacterized protein n=1 Tax=Dentipellis fragilis TaxID=205917 RepID=A0A4Y9Y5T4_9AGAM|nr:hypothetical protein EVG20_g8520 [Dentipellis fragilis]